MLVFIYEIREKSTEIDIVDNNDSLILFEIIANTSSIEGYNRCADINNDGTITTEDFSLLLDKIGEYDLVTVVRSNRKYSFVKNMSSTSANGIRIAFTQDGMDDTGCPLKVIKTEYAKKIPRRVSAG